MTTEQSSGAVKWFWAGHMVAILHVLPRLVAAEESHHQTGKGRSDGTRSETGRNKGVPRQVENGMDNEEGDRQYSCMWIF